MISLQNVPEDDTKSKTIKLYVCTINTLVGVYAFPAKRNLLHE